MQSSPTLTAQGEFSFTEGKVTGDIKARDFLAKIHTSQFCDAHKENSMSIASFFGRLFGSKSATQALPQKRTRARTTAAASEGRPRAKRQRHIWLDAEIDRVTGPGHYIIVPPAHMHITRAQSLICARLWGKFGAGKYETKQVVASKTIRVIVK